MRENQTSLGARCTGPWCDSGITTHQAEAAEEIRFDNESLHNLLSHNSRKIGELSKGCIQTVFLKELKQLAAC